MITLCINYSRVAWAWLFLVAISGGLLAQAPLVIDFNPDNGRSDVLTRGVTNWPVGTAATMQQTIGNLTIRLEAESNGDDNGNAELTFAWWKAGYDFGATKSSDGVTTTAADQRLRLTIGGLKPGMHTLAMWHNTLDANPSAGKLTIEHAGQSTSVESSHRVTHDDDARTSYLKFQQRADEKFEVVLRPAPGQRVVLNALALDQHNPALQIRHASPIDGNEHTIENPTLTWDRPLGGGSSPKAYQVYFGTDMARVQQATTSSAEYLGTPLAPAQAVEANDPLCDYFWRVDTLFKDGTTIPGKVHRFKVRALAFPSAEGYGRFAIGGRGGRVIEVTNLNDSGPGSLREAVEATGPRTIVFRVSGTIPLKSKLIIRHPYITIAGQTAPGDGICVRGYTFGCLGAHDVIMRYVRIRVGDESGETMDGTGFASTDHAIFDHCSISWSIDEAVSSRGAKNITLQRCLVAEALNIANHRKYQPGKGHSFAASISGDIGSFHHNLLVHCAGRNWSLAGGLDRGGKFAGRLDIRNNVVYNWQHRTNDGGVKALNLVNNLYLPGPASQVFHLLKPDAGSPQDPQQYFVTGNSLPGKFEASGDNWQDAVQVDPELLTQIKLTQPFCEPYVTTHPTDQLLNNVLADVGANHSGCDSVDARLIDEVRHHRTTFKGSRSQTPGIIDSQSDVGGWPELKSAEPPTDADHDGMDDAWERDHGLNPNVADHNQPLAGGPTALEVYMNSLTDRATQSEK